MKGKIIHFNQEKSFGFIMGENGENYFFHMSDTNLPFEVSKNKMVSFNTSSNQKGLCAKNIVLEKGKTVKHDNTQKSQQQYKQSQPKKKKFVLIGDITVNLNDVKSAEVHGDWRNAKLLIKTYSSGTLIGYYGTRRDFECNDFNDANNKAREDLEKLLDQL